MEKTVSGRIVIDHRDYGIRKSKTIFAHKKQMRKKPQKSHENNRKPKPEIGDLSLGAKSKAEDQKRCGGPKQEKIQFKKTCTARKKIDKNF